MRKRLALVVLVLAGLAAPANATGGLLCKTADGSDVEIALGFGHVPGAPLIGVRLREKGRTIAAASPQWWLDGRELRLVLTDEQALATLATLHARRKGPVYDGTIAWKGRSRWIRCREN